MSDDEESTLMGENLHPDRGMDSRKKWREIELGEIQNLVYEDVQLVSASSFVIFVCRY